MNSLRIGGITLVDEQADSNSRNGTATRTTVCVFMGRR